MICNPTDLTKGQQYEYKNRIFTYSYVGEGSRGEEIYVFRNLKDGWAELNRDQLRDVTAIEQQLLPQIDLSRFEAFNNQ